MSKKSLQVNFALENKKDKTFVRVISTLDNVIEYHKRQQARKAVK